MTSVYGLYLHTKNASCILNTHTGKKDDLNTNIRITHMFSMDVLTSESLMSKNTSISSSLAAASPSGRVGILAPLNCVL